MEIDWYEDRDRFERVEEEVVEDEYEVVEEDRFEVVEDDVEVVEDEYEVVAKPDYPLSRQERFFLWLCELRRLNREYAKVQAKLKDVEEILKIGSLKYDYYKLKRLASKLRSELRRLGHERMQARIKLYELCERKMLGDMACEKCPYNLQYDCLMAVRFLERRKKRGKKFRSWFRKGGRKRKRKKKK